MAPVRTSEVSVQISSQISPSEPTNTEISSQTCRSLVLRRHFKLQTRLSSRHRAEDAADKQLDGSSSLQLHSSLPQARRRVLHIRSPRTTSISSIPYPILSTSQSATPNVTQSPGASNTNTPVNEGASAIVNPSTSPITLTKTSSTLTTQSAPSANTTSEEPILLRIRSALSKPQLPPQDGDLKGRLTLVLDLDETLLHSAFPDLESGYLPKSSPDLVVPLQIATSMSGGERQSSVHVWLRQGLAEFMEKVASFCEVIIYTASHESYARPVIEKATGGKNVHGRLYREHTLPTAYGFVKDLNLLGRPLSRVLIVDNNPVSFARNPDNGIAVKSFYGEEENDYSLTYLVPYIQHLSEADDVRPILRQRFDWISKMPEYCTQVYTAMMQKKESHTELKK